MKKVTCRVARNFKQFGISRKFHSTETLTSLIDSFHVDCMGVSPAPRKGPCDDVDVGEGDM